MKKLNYLILLTVVLMLAHVTSAQNTEVDPEVKLKELGIELRVPGPPLANFVPAVRVGNLVFLSGQGPLKADGQFMTGKVGKVYDIKQAQGAARLTGINLLEALKAEIGNLNNVKRIVKVLGMVNAVPDFDQHPKVMNGFSDFMVEVFGERGRHARSAVGMGSLPFNIPVEIEMIVEIKDN